VIFSALVRQHCDDEYCASPGALVSQLSLMVAHDCSLYQDEGGPEPPITIL
jgi:hypothetical protein